MFGKGKEIEEMGAGASANSSEAQRLLSAFEQDAKKPANASDLPEDVEALKQEIVDLRSRIRQAIDTGKSLNEGDEKKLQDELSVLLHAAMEVEKTVTPYLQDVVKECGGELVGLNHRFKTRESLERKIKGDIEAKKRSLAREGKSDIKVDVANIVKSIGDALRYTMLVPEDKYVEVVLSTRTKLEEMGNPGNKFKNFWEKGDMYQGINDTYRNSATNFVFELQYHTPGSFELKAESHVIYEKFRVCPDPSEQQKLFEEGVRLAETLPIPPGVESIPVLVKNPEPNVIAAYAYLIHTTGQKRQAALMEFFHKFVGDEGIVKVDVDDLPTIEAELVALMDVKDNQIPVDEIVQFHYFFGISVVVAINNPSKYTDIVERILVAMKEPAEGDGVPIRSSLVTNHWKQLAAGHLGQEGTFVPGINIEAIAGSQATKYPEDNLLFEVLLTTEQAIEICNKITVRKVMLANQVKKHASASMDFSEVNSLWSCVEVPTGMDTRLGNFI